MSKELESLLLDSEETLQKLSQVPEEEKMTEISLQNLHSHLKGIKEASKRQGVFEKFTLKQHDAEHKETEKDIAKAMEPFFAEQINLAASNLFLLASDDVKGKTSVPEAEAIAGNIFDESEWLEPLVDTLLPSLAEAAGKAMKTELSLLGFDLEKLSKFQMKSSTATEWLQMTGDLIDFSDMVFATPYGMVSMSFASEYPEWMVKEIKSLIQETFQQPYWAEVSKTTYNDVLKYVEDGLIKGQSYAEMAKAMAPDLLQKGKYAKKRGMMIAKTEAGNALNGARSKAIDAVIKETGQEEYLKKTWRSVLGNTTRATHANLDGVPANAKNEWNLGGYQCRHPSDVHLPAHERINCYCTIITSFGMIDDEAQFLVHEAEERLLDLDKSYGVWFEKNCGSGESGQVGFQSNNNCAAGANMETGVSGSESKKVGEVSGVMVSALPLSMHSVKAASMIKGMEEDFQAGKWDKSGDSFMAKILDEASEAYSMKLAAKKGSPADVKAAKNAEIALKMVSKAHANLSAAHFQMKDAILPPVEKISEWKKIGDSQGTEKGGLYEFEGKKYYVKIPDDPARAHNELLTQRLYALAGAKCVQGNIIDIDGKVALATPWEETSQKVDWSKKTEKFVAENAYSAHAWLNNRDAIGAGSENPMDNIRKVESKQIPGVFHQTLIDAGGGLDFKGMGGSGKKEFGPDAKEWHSMRSDKNPTMKKVFGGMSQKALQLSAKRLQKINDMDIANIVAEHGKHMTPAQKTTMTNTLIARKNAILVSAGVKPASPAAQKVAGVKIDNPKPSQKPAAGPVVAPPVPAPPKQTSSKTGQQVAAKLNKIYEAGVHMSETGSMEKMDKIITNAKTKSKYPTIIHAYKMDVINAVANGAKPSSANTEKVKASKEKIKEAQKKQPYVFKASQFPEEPTFYTSNEAHKKINSDLIGEIQDAAVSGNMAAIELIHKNAKSPKIKEYAQAVKAEVANSLNPPPPPKKIDGTYSTVLEQVKGLTAKSKAGAGIESVGYWSVVQKFDGIPDGIPEGKWIKSYSSDETHLHETIGKSTYQKMTGHKKDIKSYTGGGYVSMNQALRDGDINTSYGKSAIKAATGIMKKGHAIPEGIKLSRKHNAGGTNFDIKNLTPGTVVSDRGLLSTSTDESVWSGTIQWKMTVGPGVKGLAVGTSGVSNHPGEREVVLPPNQRIMVTKVIPKANQYYHVEAVILPTEDSQCCPP